MSFSRAIHADFKISSHRAATLVTMKTKQTVIALLLALAPIHFSQASESGTPNDKTLSPYFHVKAAGDGGAGNVSHCFDPRS